MRAFRFLSFVFLGVLLASAPVYAAEHGGGEGGKEGGGEHGKTAEDTQKENKSKRDEAATITGGQTEEDPIYLHLAPLTFPVIADNGAQQIITMLIDLHVKDREKAEKMQAGMPRLKDSILERLYGGMADGSMKASENMMNIPRIKEDIAATGNKMFGEGWVEDVLIQGVSQRKL